MANAPLPDSRVTASAVTASAVTASAVPASQVSACHVLGRGLACALGPDLPRALARWREVSAGTPLQPVALTVAPDTTFPYHPIDDGARHTDQGHAVDGQAWYIRARRLIIDVVAQCGPDIDRGAPLFIASSSLNVGALENGAAFLPDCQTFIELVAAWLDWRGPVFWVATACTSSLNAMLSARRMIVAGAADEALVLGVELANRFSLAGFGAMQLLDSRPARPLAADRAGLMLGEAVAAMRLGRHTTRWRFAGGANLVDGDNPSGATHQAVASVMAGALAVSGLLPADIDLIKLQAAGSPQNDAEEITGLRAVFAQPPALVTLKPLLGHTLGASGVAELVLLMASLEQDTWPGETAGSDGDGDGDEDTTDRQLQVRLARQRPPRVRLLMAQTLGFGGGHTCVVMHDREALS